MDHILEIHSLGTFYGPNPYCRSPAIVDALTLRGCSIENAHAVCEEFRRMYPDWLEEPIDLALSPAVAVGLTASRWALAALTEVRGFLTDAGAVTMGQGASVWLGFHHPAISRQALRLSFSSIAHLLRSECIPDNFVQSRLSSLWRRCREWHPDYQATILMQAATADRIPFTRLLPGSRFWQFGWGSRSKLFFESASNADGIIGVTISRNKASGKAMMTALGAPTVPHILADNPAKLSQVPNVVGWPCVVKPVDRGSGKGVTANITTPSALESAFSYASQFTNSPIMVEAFIPGDDYRLLVLEGKLIAAIRREPSSIEGDGIGTVREKIQLLNKSRTANLVKSRFLSPVPIDEALDRHLASQGVSLESVLPSGKKVTLRSNANRSTGGICTDVTRDVHANVRVMAEAIASSSGLSAAGLDYITTDITLSWGEAGGAFIEINATPGLASIIAAGADPRSLGKEVLGPVPGRIPLVLAVLDAADLETLPKRLQGMDLPETVAWACGDSVFVRGCRTSVRPDGPWSGVKAILGHRAVSAALVACSVEDIRSYGAPVDFCDRVYVAAKQLAPEWRSVLATSTRELLDVAADQLSIACMEVFACGAGTPSH